MYRRHGQKLSLVFLGCDLAVTAGSWFAAYFLRFGALQPSAEVPELRHVVAALLPVMVLAIAAYRLCGLYAIHRLKALPREMGVVCRASGLLFVLAITVAFYRRDLYESRLALGFFLVLNAVGLTLVRRLVWWGVKHLRRRGLNHGRAVVVGCGRTGRRVVQTIRRNAWTGLEAVGYVDTPPKVEPQSPPRLGTIEELPRVVETHGVDHVFIALPLSRYAELPRVYEVLADLLVEVQLVPDLPNLAGMRIRTLEVDDVSFLSLRGSPHYGWARAAKRAMDLVIASIALVVLSPLMVLLAILVKVTSPGPVFYRQLRAGLGGRQFQMLKFRSMFVDAESQTGPVWATRGDRRVTPLGRIMRKWNLDELPQLFNVLAGDMSLVGPRPERGVFIEKFRRQLPGYMQRHQVKAGITGWAQVNGWRGNTSLRRRLECDLYYIANWSLWFDLKILWLTLWRSFRDPNAY